MRILVVYDSNSIISAEVAQQVASIFSPENFICDTYENIIAFFTLKGFDTSVIVNLKNSQL